MEKLIEALRMNADAHPLDVELPVMTKAADALESQAREIERLKEGQESLILVRDDYKKQAHDYRARWASAIASGNAPVGAIEAIRAEFPLFDDADLDQETHHCEWSVQHDRKRLHALLASLKAQPYGVVDAQRLLDWNRSQPEPRPIVVGREYQVAEACARLNPPATGGDDAERAAQVNDWFLSLPPERQAVLRNDKWLLADAAFEAGKARALPVREAVAINDSARWAFIKSAGGEVTGRFHNTRPDIREQFIDSLLAAAPSPSREGDV